MKKNATKRSLVLSILSLVLCVAMLLGTTFAWFTDSVTSGRNTIVAGNLDIELTHTNAKVTDQKVQDATDLFDVALWEPGVIAYENFTVSNIGNLALKYALNLNVFDKNATNEGHNLTEVIKVAVIDGGFKPTGTTAEAKRAEAQALSFGTLADFQKTGNLAGKSGTTVDSDTYGVVLYWQPTDHDNDYNVNNGKEVKSSDLGVSPESAGNALFVEFGVNLVAAQDTVEADSFDEQYDATAPLAVMSTPMTKKLADTGSLKIVVPEGAGSSVKEATVPAAVANAVFDEVFESTPETTDKSLTLVLNVEEKSKTETTFNYEIDMDAVIKEVSGSTVIKNETKSVNDLGLTFTDFVEVQMNIDSGLSNVKVKHNGNDMTEVADLVAAKAYSPEDADGYFNYNADGLTKLWIKSFSPFVVTGEKPITKVTATITEKANVELVLSGRKFLVYAGMSTFKSQDCPFDVTIEAVAENGEDVIAVTTSAGVEYYKLSITGNLRNANEDADPNVCLYACGNDINSVVFTKGTLDTSTELWGISIGSDEYPWGAQFIK